MLLIPETLEFSPNPWKMRIACLQPVNAVQVFTQQLVEDKGRRDADMTYLGCLERYVGSRRHLSSYLGGNHWYCEILKPWPGIHGTSSR